jgi:hypothetical protein
MEDWNHGHQYWCGKAGEIGYDYEIRESANKGLGVFALRGFEKGAKIMAERPLVRTEYLKPSEQSAILNLMPQNCNELKAKFELNAIGIGGKVASSSHVFVTMSRINHHCIGNSDHYYIVQHGVKILTACRKIEQNEEITFSYIDFMNQPRMYPFLQRKWGFECGCSGCSDASNWSKLRLLQPLDERITLLGRCLYHELGLATCDELLQLYDELHASPLLYMRTYYDMFQIAITRRRTLPIAIEYAQKALEQVLLMFGEVEIKEVEKYRQLAREPTNHPAYLLAE